MSFNSPPKTLGGVQALRFFAAFAVLFAHLQKDVAENVMPNTEFFAFQWIDGGVGVDIFFVISGFIIYHVSKAQFGQAGAASSFLLKRLLRVAPLYYLCTVATLAVGLTATHYVHSGEITFWQVACSLLFIPHQNSVGQITPILKLGWTLNYEFFFYAIFSIALVMRKKRGIPFLILCIASLAIARAISPVHALFLDFWGDSIVFEFLGGILIAMGLERNLRLPALLAVLLIIAALGGLAGLRAMDLLPLLPRAVFAGIPAVMIVAATVYGRLGDTPGPLQKALIAMGDASYALYLTHPFSLRGMMLIWARLSLPQVPYMFLAVTMVEAILVALLTHWLIEKPLNNKLRNWSRFTMKRHDKAGGAITYPPSPTA